MSKTCIKDGCTVDITGECLLSNDPATCEFRTSEEHSESAVSSDESANEQSVQNQETLGDDATSGSEGDGELVIDPVLDTPVDDQILWSNNSFGIPRLREMMAERQCHLVCMIGPPKSGKTAALVSLYLLAAHNKLEGFEFSNSETLMAFEEISFGARRWAETPPDEMTGRTELSDTRVAGFLHLQLVSTKTARQTDYIFPDLPGEWTDAFTDQNRGDRFGFIHSASEVWLFVNGSELRELETRNFVIHRTTLLFERLAALTPSLNVPVNVIITHADRGELPERDIAKIAGELQKAGLVGGVTHIASFSEDLEIAMPGSGLASLFENPASVASRPYHFDHEPIPTPDRFMLRFDTGGER